MSCRHSPLTQSSNQTKPNSDGGERRYMVLLFFLADSTVEVDEVQLPNSGRDGPKTFLARQKLPKVFMLHYFCVSRVDVCVTASAFFLAAWV